jgi:phage shock protein A
MSQDVAQWLAEIKSLKQQMADLQTQLQQSYQSADNWQRRYEVEAQQRRIEVGQTQDTVAQLQREILRLQGHAQIADDEQAEIVAMQAGIDATTPPEELRQRLVAVIIERDRLAAALLQEQTTHAETRRNLTTALGDAIDLLAKTDP